MKNLFSKTTTVAVLAILILGGVAFIAYKLTVDKKTETEPETEPETGK